MRRKLEGRGLAPQRGGLTPADIRWLLRWKGRGAFAWLEDLRGHKRGLSGAVLDRGTGVELPGITAAWQPGGPKGKRSLQVDRVPAMYYNNSFDGY